jgi:dTDP-4-amino-4,6-dideoxygalactose transaminase
MISVPYGLDLNDSVIYAIEKHSMPEMKLRIEQAIRTFEREITESSDNRVLTIPLHPHLSSSVAQRINFLTDIVEGLQAPATPCS